MTDFSRKNLKIEKNKITSLNTEDKKTVTKEYQNLKPLTPTVFASFYPESNSVVRKMEQAIRNLVLNDPVVTIQSADSASFGVGFKLGFLGSLHMEVFTQRLK